MASIHEVFAPALEDHQAGNLQQAQHLYSQILAANPDHAEARINLANALLDQGMTNEAAKHFRHAVDCRPDYAGALIKLGIAFYLQNDFDEAAAVFRMALRHQPDLADAHNNLACALNRLGELEQAEFHARQALRLRTPYPEAYVTLGNALRKQQKLNDAVASHREALRMNPYLVEAHKGLGNALQDRGEIDEALRCYRQALLLAPYDAQTHLNAGNAFARLNNLEEAIRLYGRALELQPSLIETHYGLGCVFLGQGRPDLAAARFRHMVDLQWNLNSVYPSLLFSMNYDPWVETDAVFAEHCKWGQLQEKSVTVQPHVNKPTPDRPLRVGYLSPDLCEHALIRYLEPVLLHHDPLRVEVYCYAEVAEPDDVTSRLQRLAQGWCNTCRLTDAQLADCIRGDRIDILVDLASHTRNSRMRVMARKPAPIQATWLGYLNTTGLTRVDYRLTDDNLDPPGQPCRDTEELLRLSGGACCFMPPLGTPSVTPPPILRNNYLTFGSLNGLLKLNSKVLELWSRVLLAVPRSRLLIFQHTLTDTTKERLRRQFAQLGVGGERLDLRRAILTPGYLKIYEDIDISLDTFPCTGGVTTCESLWMGVPVVTLCGERPAGRHSAALLARVGLTNWAVSTPQQYVDLAASQSLDIERLVQLRSVLRDRVAANLGDAAGFTRKLENAYRAIWRRWCKGQEGERDYP